VPLALTPFECDAVCYGNTWIVEDKDFLAEQIAKVALGQSHHVEKILSGASIGVINTPQSVILGAINLLTVNDADPWHRDGWMFQVMSWIAAHKASPGSIIHPPHMILAHKGFDGLQLQLDETSGLVSAAIIFEDKATDNSRSTIRDEVWPAFLEIESGARDNILTAEVVALLRTRRDIDSDVTIQNIIWKQARQYRLSITVGQTHNSDAGRRRLFKHYDIKASGDIQRRRAETFFVQQLREWMADLAAKAIVVVNSQGSNDV
jgi:hypothetical protein